MNATMAEFPFKRTQPFAPPPEYKAIRSSQPITKVRLWDGTDSWIVTKYEDVKQVLSDENFSNVATRDGYPMLTAARSAFLKQDMSFIQMDAPDHTRLRRMLTKDFIVRRVENMRPKIQAITDDLIDAMIKTGSPADFVQQVAAPLPALVVFEMLGVPFEDHEFFQKRSHQRGALNVEPHVPVQAGNEMGEYLSALLTKKENNPHESDDLLSRLVLDYIQPGLLSHKEAVAMARLLIMAGHETTTNMISLGTLALMQNPQQLQALKADPSLIKGAVEELLRYLTILQFMSGRVAKEDVLVGGQLIRKGEGVFALLVSANHDPTVFEEPDKLDITRKNNFHVAFGFGIHQCLGQPLARAELQIIYETLFRRLPDIRPAVDVNEIPFKNDMFIYGVHSMPVAWG